VSDHRPIGDDDLHALLDGRLPPERRAAIDAYLRENSKAAEQVEAYQAQREALRDRLAFKASERLPTRLRVRTVVAERRQRIRQKLTSLVAAVALAVLGAGVGWWTHAWLSDAARTEPTATGFSVAEGAIQAHRIFAVEVVHPVEVPRSQEQHLVQWLSKRLGRQLHAPDLRANGFQLMGGRLLSAGTGPAAQFMYENSAGARLTLYVQAGGSGQTAFRFAEAGGISAFYWVEDGFGYALSSALHREQLLDVAGAAYRQIEGNGPT
jgi:anti-sigma factor RsiW